MLALAWIGSISYSGLLRGDCPLAAVLPVLLTVAVVIDLAQLRAILFVAAAEAVG